jgi:hypothetical protein
MAGRFLYRDESTAFFASMQKEREERNKLIPYPERLKRIAEEEARDRKQRQAERIFLDYLLTHDSTDPWPFENPFEVRIK